MPLNKLNDIVSDLVLLDIGIPSMLHFVAYTLVGELTILQQLILGLNGILVIARLALIIKKWNKDG